MDIKLCLLNFISQIIFASCAYSVRHSRILAENQHVDVEPKVIDVFMFNGEPMAFFRILYLKDVVDYFIVVEAGVTLSGKRKKTMYIDDFKSALFSPMVSTGQLKPTRVSFPNNMLNMTMKDSSWVREAYLRDYGKRAALEIMGSSPFVMIVCDADELPSKEFIASLKANYTKLTQPMRMIMPFFYYSFKWRSEQQWTGAYVANDKFIRNDNITLTQTRQGTNQINYLHQEWAGWHCSYCMTVKQIVRKLKSSPHTELDLPQFVDEAWVRKCRTEGIDLFNRAGHVLTKYMGRRGYPVCEECKKLPDYKVLEIPI